MVNKNNTLREYGIDIPLEEFIGPDFPGFKAALIAMDISRLLREKVISDDQVGPLKEDIRNGHYKVEEDKENGENISKNHPRCKFAKMTFESLPSVPLICFVKRRSLDDSKHAVELYVPEIVRGSLSYPATPKCIFNNGRVIAYELFSPSEISVENHIQKISNNPAEMKLILDKITKTVSDIHSISLSPDEIKLLSTNNYASDHSKWKIPELAEKDYVQGVVESLTQYTKSLNNYGKGLIHNDLHLGNMHLKGQDIVSLIDWEWAMLGAPQTDITRIAMGLRFDNPKNADKEGELVKNFYNALAANKMPVGSLEEFKHIYTLAKAHQYGIYADIERRHVEINQGILSKGRPGIDVKLAQNTILNGQKNMKAFASLGLKTCKEAYKQ
ncbi:MAG: phosphotransferase [Nanoarchaeota archaeon]|nr:phosphotransferase [Nanoarchaeota archaeon]